MKDLFLPLHPEGWAAPRGYSDGIVAFGRLVFVSGQVGWNPATAAFESDDFAAQAEQALANVATVLRVAGGDPAQLVRMTWSVTDRDAYGAARGAARAVVRTAARTGWPAPPAPPAGTTAPPARPSPRAER